MQQQNSRLFLVLKVMLQVQDQGLIIKGCMQSPAYTHEVHSPRTKLCQTLRMQTIYGIFIPSYICFANTELKALRGDCPLTAVSETEHLKG